MAQVEQYKGKLGFEHRSEEKLTLALTELLDTLEEFGHPALQINARDPHRIGLDCDQYKVSLRLRRIPMRLGVRTPRGVPAPAAYIELALSPYFPEACDQEITEILLAMVLKRLTEALAPLVIFWQDSNRALTPQQFIGAFAPKETAEPLELSASPVMDVTEQSSAIETADDMPADEQTNTCAAQTNRSAPIELPAIEQPPKALNTKRSAPVRVVASSAHSNRLEAGRSSAAERLWLADQARAEAEAERARGQARFGSADEVTSVLERHCDEIQHFPNPQNARKKALQHAHTSYDTVFGKSRLGWLLALPRTTATMLSNGFRSVDLAFSIRALLTSMVVLFLHGSGMVQAAARVFMPQ